MVCLLVTLTSANAVAVQASEIASIANKLSFLVIVDLRIIMNEWRMNRRHNQTRDINRIRINTRNKFAWYEQFPYNRSRFSGLP